MPVLVPVLTIIALASAALGWAAYGLPGLFNLTFGVMNLCQSLFVRCLEYTAILKVVLVWLGIFALAGGLLYAAFKNIKGLLKAHGIIKAMPLMDKGSSVVLIKDDLSKAAFTHGLIKPRIYISTGLIKSLERSELLSVFAHELHHKRNYDPLRFFLFNFLRDAFFYLPLISHFVGVMLLKKECEADDAAIAAISEPVSLAEALVKVASFNRASFAPASFTGNIEGGSISGRVRRIIEGRELKFKRPALRAITISLFIAGLLMTSILLPLHSAASLANDCSTEHCSTHINKLGDDCRTHCKTSHKH
ncbi:MAG: M48 family metalloprotease [Deltaproteobacteria bacterium]|nr:M48 family metalloprotease [Deltaproteobacteria bacterium]